MGHKKSKPVNQVDANANEILAKSKNSINPDLKAKSCLEKQGQKVRSPGCVSNFRTYSAKSVWKIENWKLLASSGKQVFHSHGYGIWIESDGNEENIIHR